ncbi:MAG: 3'-5' exonuclease [Thermoanaerobaculia bacterium]
MFFRSPKWNEIEYWALDLETSGLDPRSDQILSVGMVPIRDGVICWGDHFYSLVLPGTWDNLDGDAVGIHHILPEELRGAPPLETILLEIEMRLSGGAAMVFHHAPFDLGFLRQAFQSLGRRWRSPAVVDTRVLVSRFEERQQQLVPYAAPITRQLSELVQLFNLPPYTAHHALGDALATAELFLALRARLELRTFRQVRCR